MIMHLHAGRLVGHAFDEDTTSERLLCLESQLDAFLRAVDDG